MEKNLGYVLLVMLASVNMLTAEEPKASSICSHLYNKVVGVYHYLTADFDLENAVIQGDIEGIAKAIQAGANINARFTLTKPYGKYYFRDYEGLTVLHLAADVDLDPSKKLKLVKALLEHGADPNARDDQSFTPLHWAAGKSNSEVVQLLIDHGADVNALAKYFIFGISFKATPLTLAKYKTLELGERRLGEACDYIIVEILKRNGGKSVDDLLREEYE